MSETVTFIVGGQKFVLDRAEIRNSDYLHHIIYENPSTVIELPLRDPVLFQQLVNVITERSFKPSLALYALAVEYRVINANEILEKIEVPPENFVKFVQDFLALMNGYGREQMEIIASKIQEYIDLSALGPDVEFELRSAASCDYTGSPIIDTIVSQLKEDANREGGPFKTPMLYTFILSRSVNGPVLIRQAEGYGPVDAFLRERRYTKNRMLEDLSFMQTQFDLHTYDQAEYALKYNEIQGLPDVIIPRGTRLLPTRSVNSAREKKNQWLSPTHVIIADKRPSLIEMDILSWYAIGNGVALNKEYPRWHEVLTSRKFVEYIATQFDDRIYGAGLLVGAFFEQVAPAPEPIIQLQKGADLQKTFQTAQPKMPPASPRAIPIMPSVQPAAKPIFPVQSSAAPVFSVPSAAPGNPIFPMPSAAPGKPIFPMPSAAPGKPIFPMPSAAAGTPIFPMPSARPPQ